MKVMSMCLPSWRRAAESPGAVLQRFTRGPTIASAADGDLGTWGFAPTSLRLVSAWTEGHEGLTTGELKHGS